MLNIKGVKAFNSEQVIVPEGIVCVRRCHEGPFDLRRFRRDSAGRQVC